MIHAIVHSVGSEAERRQEVLRLRHPGLRQATPTRASIASERSILGGASTIGQVLPA
jgi:hypothetical protein